jgi:hypothetical protein
VAARLAREPRAFAFLGGVGDPPHLRGYGIAPADGVETPLAEAIFCTQVFAGRALPGRFLVRCELAGEAAAADATALAAAEVELRRFTGTSAEFGFRKVHRFVRDVRDGALAECRARLHTIAGRATGLAIL